MPNFFSLKCLKLTKNAYYNFWAIKMEVLKAKSDGISKSKITCN